MAGEPWAAGRLGSVRPGGHYGPTDLALNVPFHGGPVGVLQDEPASPLMGQLHHVTRALLTIRIEGDAEAAHRTHDEVLAQIGITGTKNKLNHRVRVT